jgi:hypothetical protein
MIEGVLQRTNDRPAIGAPAVRIAREHTPEKRRRKNEPIATRTVLGKVVTDDFLGMAERVNVRGIDEIASALEVIVDNGVRRLDAGSPPEILSKSHGTEAKG